MTRYSTAPDVAANCDEIVDSSCSSLAATRDVVYLTPGVALLADVTVERLIEAADNVVLVPGEHVLAAGGDAQAQSSTRWRSPMRSKREPFGAGLRAVDPHSALVVSNWYGATVTRARRAAATAPGLFSARIDADEDSNLYLGAQDT